MPIADQESVKNFLTELLTRATTPQGITWLEKQLAEAQTESKFFQAFSMAPRFIGKRKIEITEADTAAANALRTGFNPQGWTADQAARTSLALSLPHQSPEEYIKILDKLFATADVNELVALYAALPVLPYPEKHIPRMAEGVRTNMTLVFEAVALQNPYPHDYLPEEAWNQLVLKSIFTSRPLYRIYGLENRRNKKLAQTLSDFAHERWAAGRTLSPEVWRNVGPFVDETIWPDIQKLFTQPNELEQQAAALVCAESNYPEAKTMLDTVPDLKAKIENGELTWDTIGEDVAAQTV
ncbi:hypothetical protein AHMF7605_16625 [Adhaeribacter arboris]|uniref:EboA domain-containing protein n=1 Tax=Adhaeribacter arboris TaxID=2072846 RepID=A0A2T2YHM4_9BACT|nr:EboA domain-containing protein [Adhaeribacter arboris]PSR55013.1 hypothetical protein AHMF7605_16625 [Adhaeribacter arboris]